MGPIYSILKKEEEAKNDEPVVATVSIPLVHEGSEDNAVVREVTQRSVRKRRAPVSSTDEQPARKTRKKAKTVSPSIPTEEDSTPLQEESIDVMSPRKGRKRALVNNSAEEPAIKSRKKAKTVSPSIPTEEDSTPLQEDCIKVVSPKKGRKGALAKNSDEQPARKTGRKAKNVDKCKT
nr:uncharacterized protein LOC108016996 isoform X2 [Drosophila suzukii]